MPPDNSLNVTGTIDVFIGTQIASNVKAYLAPGQIGIYFVTAVLPAAAPLGDTVNVLVRVNGIDSQTVTMAIR